VIARFRSHLESSNLIPPGNQVLVGFSGGADSTCLLHMLRSLNIPIFAGYLHHKMRPEADSEQSQLEEFCSSVQISFVSGAADVPKLSRDRKVGIEEAGRLARYHFFEKAAAETGCSLIATAHTASDQAETILLNIVRGSGMGGVLGIPERRANIIRPLLPFFRHETEEYCKYFGLETLDDPGNFDENFARVRVRRNVFPELEKVNSKFSEHLLQFSSSLADEDRYLNGLAAATLERCEVPINGELGFLTEDVEVHLDRACVSDFPAVLVKRAIRLVTGVLGQSFDRLQVTTVLDLLKSGSNGSVTAEGGNVVAEIDKGTIQFRNIKIFEPFRFPLTIPGETESMEFGWRFEAFEGDPEPQKRTGCIAILNSSKIRGNLFLRTIESGDEIEPFGFDGTRKASDIVGEFGLTLLARKRLPIICDMLGPIWIPGICLSNRVQLTAESNRALHVRFMCSRTRTEEVSETIATTPAYGNGE
jgi:tRNA(Ile)-lysidine synthase